MEVVEIKREAFVQIVAAAYESLRVECTGFLGGEKYGRRIEVRLAQPAQMVERRPGSAVYDNEWKRIREIISRDYDFLGGFHSHLKTIVQEKLKRRIDFGSVMLSETDMSTMMDQYPEGIEIIVAMNPSKRKIPVQVSENRITGYIGNGGRRNYRLDIGAYYLDAGMKKRRAELHVPRRVLNAVFC